MAESCLQTLPAVLPAMGLLSSDADEGDRRRLSQMTVIRELDTNLRGPFTAEASPTSPESATASSWLSTVPSDEPCVAARPSFSRRCKKLSLDQHEPRVFDLERMFKTCDIFRFCSSDFVRRLIDAGGAASQSGQTFDAEYAILHQGGYSQDLFVIHRGTCDVEYNGEVVNTIASGEVFGEMGLLGLVPRATATVRTKTICHILRISATAFVQTLKQFPRERRLFEKEVATRYRKIVETQMCHRTKHHLKEVRDELAPQMTSRYNSQSTSGWQDTNQSTSIEIGPLVQKPQRARRRLALSTPPHGPAIAMPDEEVMMKRLKMSLGSDSRRGFKASVVGGLLLDTTEALHEDEDSDATDALDAKLLPPIPMLSASQKHGLLRQLRHQCSKRGPGSKLRRGMSKVKLLTSGVICSPREKLHKPTAREMKVR